ncbi:MAG TPA: AAA family ATPase [Kiritimatiellia bacterium]|nr:AAA family ATPase [Kiritimatiellia bacterium]
MTDQNEEKKLDRDEVGKQLQDMLKQARIQFMQFPGMGETSAGEADREDIEDAEAEAAMDRIRSFQLKPREVRDYLDRYVIRQDEAKKVLSVAICDHYNHVRRCLDDTHAAQEEYTKQNVILLGPTGVGKTYLMRCIAKLIGVPFVKADATKFSETGYVGYDVDDIVRDLVRAANNDPDLAQYGIVYIDEIDKIATKATAGARDVSGRGVQTNLLKLMEETEVNLQSQTDLVGQMQAIMEMQRGGKPRKRTVNTRHILFIVSGAFDGLHEIIRKRVASGAIGFGSAQQNTADDDQLLKATSTSDFISYGFEPEFIGRLPVRVVCENLNADDLEKILLQSEGSILKQYVQDFHGYGISMTIKPSALRQIAEKAALEKTGARGLMTVLENILRDFKFELPSTTVKELTIDDEALGNPAEVMKRIFKENEAAQRQNLLEEVTRYAERFAEETGLTVKFTDDAAERIVEESLKTHKTVRGICEERFRDYEFGLKLINKNTGQQEFVITRQTVENSVEEISKWVRESYAAGA